MSAREKFMIVARDSQDNTLVIGPVDSPPGIPLTAEMEEWGWTILYEAVPVMTLGRARWIENNRKSGVASR